MRFDYSILVNSYGRSGSTVLTNSIVKSAINTKNEVIKDFAMRSVSKDTWELNYSDLKNGVVYKTHDYPPVEALLNNACILYTFADLVDVGLSLLRLYDERGEEWMEKHYDHLKVSFGNFEKIT